MTVYDRPPDLFNDIHELKRDRKISMQVDDFDPDEAPGPVPNVQVNFRIREKRLDPRYVAVVRWDALPPGACQADIVFYVAQIRAVRPNGVERPDTRREIIVRVGKEEDPDFDFENDLKAVFRALDNPEDWLYQGRVRVIDRAMRRGEWSDWTEAEVPASAANPLPPIPTGIAVSFRKNPQARTEPRWRLRVIFNELPPWDIPPDDDISEAETTLDGAIGAGASSINLQSGAGFVQPLPGQRQSCVIRPRHANREVIAYRNRDGTTLQNVTRGLQGTDASSHPDGAKVVLRAEDAAARANDIEAYIVVIRRWNPNTNDWFVDSAGEPVRRRQVIQWRDEFEDGDNVVRVIFDNVRTRQWWRARVRTRDRFGRVGDWSEWTDPASPSDTTPPPVPTDLIVSTEQNRIVADWEAAVDPEDPELMHPDINHFNVQVATDFNFNNIIRRARFVQGTRRAFRFPRPAAITRWVRVRSVDASGNRSAWVSQPTNRIAPPNPTVAPTITFDRGGKGGIRGWAEFTYSEGANYEDDDVSHFIVQWQGHPTDPVGTRVQRRFVEVTEGEETEPQRALFAARKRGNKVRARYRVVSAAGVRSGFSPWSGIVTVTAPRTPGKVTNREVIPRLRGVLVRFDPPTTWSDLSTDDWDEGEVDRYRIELRRAGNVVDTVETKATRHLFPLTRQQASLPNWRARVFAIGHDETMIEPDPETGDVQPDLVEVDTDGLAPSASPTPTLFGLVGSFLVQWTNIINHDPVNYEIHMGTSSGFTPDANSFVGTVAEGEQGKISSWQISRFANGDAFVFGQIYFAKTIAVDADGAAAPSDASQGAEMVLLSSSQQMSDGDPPSQAPGAPTIEGGPGYLYARWTGIDNNDPPRYEVHVSTTSGFTPSGATLVGETPGHVFFVTEDANGNPLSYGTTYFVKIRVKDIDGIGPSSAQGSGQMDQIDQFDIENLAIKTAKIDDLAVTNAKILSMSVAKLTAGSLAATVTVTGTLFSPAQTGWRLEVNPTFDRVFRYWNGGTTRFYLDNNGNAVFSGLVQGATIQGGELMTATTGRRVRISGLTGQLAQEIGFLDGQSTLAAIRLPLIERLEVDAFGSGMFLRLLANTHVETGTGVPFRVGGPGGHSNNFLELRNTGGPVAAPNFGLVRMFLREDESPTRLRARFGNGTTKVLADNT